MREIRQYGSVRGVRSNPYPYRDEAPTEQVRSTAPTDGSANALLGKRCNSHPQLAGCSE